jgi:hypothetical protein
VDLESTALAGTVEGEGTLQADLEGTVAALGTAAHGTGTVTGVNSSGTAAGRCNGTVAAEAQGSLGVESEPLQAQKNLEQ